MTKTLVSPTGNHEIWPENAAPSGYVTPDDWAAAHPAPPLAPLTLEEALVLKRAEINAERDKRIAGGVAYQGVAYDSDDRAQLRITGAVMQMSLAASAGQIPPPVDWVAMDNSVQSLDMVGLISLGQTISAWLSACVLAANMHKAALDTLPGADAIMIYDFSGGWPI